MGQLPRKSLIAPEKSGQLNLDIVILYQMILCPFVLLISMSSYNPLSGTTDQGPWLWCHGELFGD